MAILDEIRAACAAVAARARSVTIDETRLAPYAASLPLETVAAPALDPEAHHLGHGEETLAFVVTLDAINFGSGYFPHLRKRPGRSGYFTVATHLAEHFRAHGPLSPAALAALDAEAVARLLGQHPADGPAAELMGLFARALNDLGRLLDDRYGGRFAALVEAADGSAERLVPLLAEMPFYRDVQRYDGLEVPFYKRAQLTAADLALAFGGEGWGRFDDLARLTIFADNLVPHVLRLDGVLRYHPALAARIDAETPLEPGSPEEVEIRACGLHAVERLRAALAADGREVTSMQLDFLLWNRGQGAHYKQSKPRHRARGVFY